MATKRDLVEAHAFSRRRLVTAFVSGAPGGREVEPPRPGRAVIGGLALAVLILAVAVALNVLDSPVPLERDREQLISEQESGADYVLLAAPGSDELVLRPVANITSAMLLLGAGAEPTVVPRDEVAALTPGPPVGILGAPTTPPAADRLVGTGWTACTGEVDGSPVGLTISVSADPAVEPTPGVSFVVRAVGPGEDDDGSLHLIAESSRGADDAMPRAYAYELPDQGARADAVLGAVAASSVAQAVEVPAAWLTTFAPGGALDLATFGLTPADIGREFPGRTATGPLEDADVGDVIEVGERSYLLTPEGTALLLDDFATNVYLGLAPGVRAPIAGGETLPGELRTALSPELAAARWPEAPTDRQPTGEPCAMLRAAPETAPSVTLGRAVPGGVASAAGVPATERVTTVDAGAGAFVRSGGWFDEQTTTQVLVDDRGAAHLVAGDLEAERLGYADLSLPVVPDSWLELLERGPTLSVAAAGCPPSTQPPTDDAPSGDAATDGCL